MVRQPCKATFFCPHQELSAAFFQTIREATCLRRPVPHRRTRRYASAISPPRPDARARPPTFTPSFAFAAKPWSACFRPYSHPHASTSSRLAPSDNGCRSASSRELGTVFIFDRSRADLWISEEHPCPARVISLRLIFPKKNGIVDMWLKKQNTQPHLAPFLPGTISSVLRPRLVATERLPLTRRSTIEDLALSFDSLFRQLPRSLSGSSVRYASSVVGTIYGRDLFVSVRSLFRVVWLAGWWHVPHLLAGSLPVRRSFQRTLLS